MRKESNSKYETRQLGYICKKSMSTSGHDGSIGRHCLSLCTTKSKLKLKDNDHHSEQSEIELNESLKTTEL